MFVKEITLAVGQNKTGLRCFVVGQVLLARATANLPISTVSKRRNYTNEQVDSSNLSGFSVTSCLEDCIYWQVRKHLSQIDPTHQNRTKDNPAI